MLGIPKMVHVGLDWRSAVTAGDVGRVRSLVASTGFFNAAEVELAANLVTERLTKGLSSGYHFVLAERGANLVGFAFYGLDRRCAGGAEAGARCPSLRPHRAW